MIVPIDSFEKKYPTAQAMFIFDNAPSHKQKPKDALDPDKMNISNGGKQLVLHDTTWNDLTQTKDGIE